MRIAFCGPMRVGKDTAAEYMQKKVGGTVMKFADPLYEMQDAIYRIAKLPLPNDGRDRGLLQWLGTDWMRNSIDPNGWVDLFEKRVQDMVMLNKNESLYSTDARFPNEILLLKLLGFTVVYLQADEQTLINRGAKLTNHESEQYMKNFTEYDYRIQNNGTLDEYFASLETLLLIPTFAQGAN